VSLPPSHIDLGIMNRSKRGIDSKGNQLRICARSLVHARPPRARADRESICLSWQRAEVDGIDLDLSLSLFLPPAPPPLLFSLVSPPPDAIHTRPIGSRGGSRLGGILALGNVRLPGRLKMSRRTNLPSVSGCGLFFLGKDL